MQKVKNVFMLQMLFTVIFAMIFFINYGILGLKSGLLAGISCVIPGVFFARKLFQHQGARKAKKIVNGFYAGEALKIILTMAFFTLIFKNVTIEPIAFFVTFIGVQATFWFAPWLIK